MGVDLIRTMTTKVMKDATSEAKNFHSSVNEIKAEIRALASAVVCYDVAIGLYQFEDVFSGYVGNRHHNISVGIINVDK